jgi:DNA processing protein
MNYENLKFRIALTLFNGIGNSLARNLIAFLGSEEAVFKERPSVLKKIPGIGDVLAAELSNHHDVLVRAEQEIEFILKHKVHVHYFADESYPHRLRECFDAPLLLYSRSSVGFNFQHVLSIVGTRNATEYGKMVCRELIEGLSAVPSVLLVSGLAYGIDICAHKAALENDLATVGVVAHGLDRIYPGHHRSVALRMLEKGGLVTEYLSQTNPDRQNFIQRNRIIAGLSDAVVVVESGVKGGALITAELGNDYNRDVFAVPGRTTDQWSKGCNSLIKNNKAAALESINDLLLFMGWKQDIARVPQQQISLFQELTDEELNVCRVLQQQVSGVQVNEIAAVLQMPFSKVSSLLLNLEFKTIVRCLPGGVYVLQKTIDFNGLGGNA